MGVSLIVLFLNNCINKPLQFTPKALQAYYTSCQRLLFFDFHIKSVFALF